MASIQQVKHACSCGRPSPQQKKLCCCCCCCWVFLQHACLVKVSSPLRCWVHLQSILSCCRTAALSLRCSARTSGWHTLNCGDLLQAPCTHLNSRFNFMGACNFTLILQQISLRSIKASLSTVIYGAKVRSSTLHFYVEE